MQLSENSKQLVQLALREDIGSGDITTGALIASNQPGKAVLLAKESLIVCGHPVVQEVFRQLGEKVSYEVLLDDGAEAKAGSIIARMSGEMACILSAERTVLNFMQRLSGIASATNEVAIKIKGSGVRVLDTRKTTPGWRELDKYAVRVGGGMNHRIGLFDAVLIKNNHLDSFTGSLVESVAACRKSVSHEVKIEVEVRDFAELEQALAAGPDEILLDNFSPADLQKAVQLVRSTETGKRIGLEASGGIRADNIEQYAVSGLDYISMGQLTHSVVAKDIALRYQR